MIKNTKITVLKDHEHPLKSPNTHLVAAAATSGAELSEQGYLDTIEQDGAGNPRRTVVWSLKEKEIEFKSFEGETISTAEFLRRWKSLEWCKANPDHPIAFLRMYQDSLNLLRDHINKAAPTLMVKRGGRTAFIPSDATEAERAKIISKL